MITLLDLGPKVLGYRVEGKVEREDIDRVFAELDRKIASGATISVYAELPSITGMSLGAILEDVRLGIQRLSVIGRIERAAVVSDVDWIRKAAQLEGKVLKGIHLRTFATTEQAEARTWVAI